MYRMEDMGAGRNLEHLSSIVNAYMPQDRLRPLFFWSRLLQINLLIIIIVFFIFLIFLIVAEASGSDAIVIVHRLRENLVGNGNTQL